MLFPTGPSINFAAVAFGGIAGALIGSRIPERIRISLPQTFGLASMALGVVMLLKFNSLPPVVLALVLGVLIGELIQLEAAIGRVSLRAKALLDIYIPARNGLSHENFLDQFVAVLILFCVSGMGIFGALNEGLTGDSQTLLVKAILDFFTAAIFAASLGYSVAILCVPQLLIQLSLFALAAYIMPLTNEQLIADFSAVGGLIMLATGFRIAKIKSFAVANMLPAIIIVMPLSALWSRVF